MGHLFNRNVLLGVSGGIAAYKSAELVRQLQEAGASVRVIMTRGAQEFITPLTLQALSGNPVHTALLDEEAERGMGHIELARWADLMLIAPATADLLARLAAGRADDLLTTVALATAAPLMLAPAMNQQMWRDPATDDNVQTLGSRGVHLVGPASGEQACGDVGPGRMEEPAVIVKAAAGLFESGLLAGKRVVVTAGPTREAIDPVRFISNPSSGKMGYAIARAAEYRGARVTLVSGPVCLEPPLNVELIPVETVGEMAEAVLSRLEQSHVVVKVAAVSDYRPVHAEPHKIKKGEGSMQLTLERTTDILKTVGQRKDRQVVVGFAAETRDMEAYARKKLQEKRLDMICL